MIRNPGASLRVMAIALLVLFSKGALAEEQHTSSALSGLEGGGLVSKQKGCGNSCYYSVSIWGSFVGAWGVFWFCVVRSMFGPDSDKDKTERLRT